MTAVVLRVKEACVTPCLLAGNGKRPNASPECFKHILFQHGYVYDIAGKRAVGIPEGAAAHGGWSVGCFPGKMGPAGGAEIATVLHSDFFKQVEAAFLQIVTGMAGSPVRFIGSVYGIHCSQFSGGRIYDDGHFR